MGTFKELGCAVVQLDRHPAVALAVGHDSVGGLLGWLEPARGLL